MAECKRILDQAPRIYQWVTDDKPCVPLELQAHTKLMVEVRGNKSGKPVQFYGSLFGAPVVLLGETSLMNDIMELPPVKNLQPQAEPGVTINFMGVA